MTNYINCIGQITGVIGCPKYVSKFKGYYLYTVSEFWKCDGEVQNNFYFALVPSSVGSSSSNVSKYRVSDSFGLCVLANCYILKRVNV